MDWCLKVFLHMLFSLTNMKVSYSWVLLVVIHLFHCDDLGSFGIWDASCGFCHINRETLFYSSWVQLDRHQLHLISTTPVSFFLHGDTKYAVFIKISTKHQIVLIMLWPLFKLSQRSNLVKRQRQYKSSISIFKRSKYVLPFWLMIFNAFQCQETEQNLNFIYKLVHRVILNFCEKVWVSCK